MARFWPKTRHNGRGMAWKIFFHQCLWVTKFCAKFGHSRILRTASIHNSFIVLRCMWKEPAPLYFLFSLRRGHWWISNLSSKISPKPAFSAGFKDRQGQRLHNALRHRVLRLLLLQRGQRGPQTGACTPSRHADHETKRVQLFLLYSCGKGECQFLYSSRFFLVFFIQQLRLKCWNEHEIWFSYS